MNVEDYSKPLILARRDKDFETPEQYQEYDRQRKLRNGSPNARCYVAKCGEYNQCRGYCKKWKKYPAKLETCPSGLWAITK